MRDLLGSGAAETFVRKETYGHSEDLQAAFFASHSGAVWDKRGIGGGGDSFTHFVVNFPLSFAADESGKVSTYLPFGKNTCQAGLRFHANGVVLISISPPNLRTHSYTFATRSRASCALNTSAQILLNSFADQFSISSVRRIFKCLITEASMKGQPEHAALHREELLDRDPE
jgi:hypothetical protein